MCPTCLGIQHLKEALTDLCLHYSLLPMSERLIRLAELHPNSAVGLGDADFQSTTHTRKHGASAAAVAPHSKKNASSRKDYMEETSLSKIVAVLSSEMSKLKCLLQTIQWMGPFSLATVSQEDERLSRRMEEELLYTLLLCIIPSLMCFLQAFLTQFFFLFRIIVGVQSFP